MRGKEIHGRHWYWILRKNYAQTDVGMLFYSWVSLYRSKLQYHHNTIITTQNYNNYIRIHMIIIAA